jgi:hypothetical protein
MPTEIDTPVQEREPLTDEKRLPEGPPARIGPPTPYPEMPHGQWAEEYLDILVRARNG